MGTGAEVGTGAEDGAGEDGEAEEGDGARESGAPGSASSAGAPVSPTDFDFSFAAGGLGARGAAVVAADSTPEETESVPGGSAGDDVPEAKSRARGVLEELMAEAQAEQDGASEDEVREDGSAEAGGDADGTADADSDQAGAPVSGAESGSAS
ncbi:hypothetical protein MWG58_06185, partial [Streptomyces sp. WAC00276]|nr:hypothetical protein [Streptomyces sp. WAC00276]